MSDDALHRSAAPPPGRPYLLTPVPSRHVQESRRLILAAAETVHPGRAVVLGAGNCAEIPLAELATRFEHLTLNDIDRQLLDEGIAAANLDAAARAKIDVRIADLTGVTQKLIEKIDAALPAVSEPEAAIDLMARIVDDEPLAQMPIDGKNDLVVASCVLSQLHFALAHRAGERFLERFGGEIERLRQSQRWTTAVYNMARRMEGRFVDGLIGLVAQGGLIYLSESPQMCYFRLTGDGHWETVGTHRMLRTQDLTGYVDRRFAIIAHGRWHWVVSPPKQAGQVGRLFDVQAVVLRVWRR